MIIATHFNRFFIALFALTAISNTHQLCTMQQESKKTSDFEIYQLLSAIKESTPENASQFLLPTEIIQKIAINAYRIMESKLSSNEKALRNIFEHHFGMYYIPMEYELSRGCEYDNSWCP